MRPSAEFIKFYRWWPKHLKIHGVQLKHCADKYLCGIYLVNQGYASLTHKNMVIYPFEFAIGITQEEVFIFPKYVKRDGNKFFAGEYYSSIPLLRWPKPELTLNEYKDVFRRMIKQVKVNEL